MIYFICIYFIGCVLSYGRLNPRTKEREKKVIDFHPDRDTILENQQTRTILFSAQIEIK